jgi:hypothetical protein
MTTTKTSSQLLWYEAFGFLLIIALSWLNELLSLPSRVFGGVPHSNWRESAMESLVALAVWLGLFLITKRILQRLYYLENFIRVCAWCRKIGEGDKWLSLEEYFSEGFAIKTSHGICSECANNLRAKRPHEA